MAVRTPHLSLPFRIVDGRAAVTEQGTDPEIIDCIQAVLRYPVGYRIELPEFGLPDQAFKEGGPSREEILAVITRWEPRAQALVTVQPDALDTLIDRVTVQPGTGENA